MRSILEIICKRFPTIVFIALAAFAMIMAGTYLSTPQYVSEARILVPLGQEMTMPATAMTQPLNVFINRAEQIQTQIEVLHSRGLIEKTIMALPPGTFEPQPPQGLVAWARHILKKGIGYCATGVRKALELAGLLPKLTEHERLVLNCVDRFSAKRQKENDLIIVGFSYPSPRLAQLFLTTFLDVYVREKSLMNTGMNVPFFEAQEQELKEKLVSARLGLTRFRAEWGILNLAPQREQLVREYSRLTTAVNENRADLVQVSLALCSLQESSNKDGPESLLPLSLRQDPGIVETLRNLASLRARESRLGTDLGRQNPENTSLQREIDLLRGVIRSEGIRILQNRVAVLQTVLGELENQRTHLQNGILTLDAKGLEMRSLETAVDVLETALLQYAQKRETSRVSAAMGAQQINAINIVESPNLAYKPVSPKPLRNLILGAIFGLLVGLAYAFVSNHMSGLINTQRDMQVCSADAVAVFLPNMLCQKAEGLGRRLRLSWSKAYAAAMASVTRSGTVVDAECARNTDVSLKDLPEQSLTMLARKIFYRGSVRHFPPTLLFTGAGHAVGTSSIARILAAHLSKVFSLRILLVQTAFADAPNTEQGCANSASNFSAWLQGAPLSPSCKDGVDFLCAGVFSSQANAAVLGLTRETFASLRQDYDMVIFDTPPLILDTIAFHLSSLAEGVIVVAQAESTRKEVFAATCASLNQSGAKILGVICNRRRFYIPDWLYQKLA